MRGHDPTQLLRNLIHLEFHFAVAVDADHGGHVCHPDMRLAGTFRPSSVAIPLMRFFACPKASPNVATLTRGCDQIGCRRFEASSARSACFTSHLLNSAILCAPCVGSSPRIWNSSTVLARLRS